MKANKLKSLLIVKCFVFGSLFMEIQGADEEKDPREEPAAATLSAVSNEDLSRFTNPRKIARIERTLSEAISNVESACGKDVVLILGNTHAGKSTIVNYLLGCTMKIEGGSRAVPTALTSSMARANTKYGSSETKFPAVYEFEDRYALCDCPGFFDIRGEEEKICGSILTEMVVRNARSLRAMVVVDFSSIQAGKGFDFIRLGDTLNKLIPKASNPLFFVFNKVPNGADKESIVKDLKEMVLCRGIDLQTEVRRCLDDLSDPRSETWSIEQQHQDALGLLPDEVKNNPNIRKHVEEFVAISVTLSRMLDIMCVDVTSESSRPDIWRILHTLNPLDREHFCFNGYDTDRVRFNKVMADGSERALKILQAKSVLTRYRSIFDDAIIRTNENIKWYMEQIERFHKGEKIDEGGDRVFNILKEIKVLDQNIINLRQDLNALDLQIKNLNVETHELYWRDEWKNSAINRLNFLISGAGVGALIGAGITASALLPLAVPVGSALGLYIFAGYCTGLVGVVPGICLGGLAAEISSCLSFATVEALIGPPEHVCRYPLSTPFVRYTEKLDDDRTVKNGGIINMDEGIFDVTYISSRLSKDFGFENCSVEIFVKKNKIPGIVNSIQRVDKEIESANGAIMDAENKIRDLKEERDGILNQQLETLHKSKRISEDRREELERIIGTFQQIDDLYREHREGINTWRRVCDMLDIKSNGAVKFKNFYDSFMSLSHGQIESSNDLVDHITAGPLLDVVQTKCGHVFNRLFIELIMERQRNCPTDSVPLKKEDLVRVSIVEMLSNR